MKIKVSKKRFGLSVVLSIVAGTVLTRRDNKILELLGYILDKNFEKASGMEISDAVDSSRIYLAHIFPHFFEHKISEEINELVKLSKIELEQNFEKRFKEWLNKKKEIHGRELWIIKP